MFMRPIHFHLAGEVLCTADMLAPPPEGRELHIESTLRDRAYRVRVTRVVETYGDSDAHTTVADQLLRHGPFGIIPRDVHVYLEEINTPVT